MKLTKQQRAQLRQKYGGRCAYCGCELPDRWCADHIEPIRRDWINGGCEHPERDTYENLAPSCPSCNTIKGSQSLEGFRRTIQGFKKSLNRDSTQYKFAKKYGLVHELDAPVVFWFELFGKTEQVG